jgi:uncharacterized protein (DUF1778 family)
MPMAKSKKNKNKAKLNLTVRDEQRKKLEQMASLENRSVSNLIEVMADERWKRLAEQQGVAYAKTVAEAMKLKPRHGQSSRPREIAPGSSRSCRREKNAKAKRRFFQSLTAIFITK